MRLFPILSYDIDEGCLVGAGAPEVVFAVAFAAVPDNPFAEGLVGKCRLNFVAQNLYVGRCHHDYVLAVELMVGSDGLQHIAELLPATENQHVALKLVAPLALAVFLRDVVEHIGEGGDGEGVQHEDASEGDQQAEDVERGLAALFGFERVAAGVEIEVEDFGPAEGPDAACEHEQQEQRQRYAGQPCELAALTLGEDAVNQPFQGIHRICLLSFCQCLSG